MPDLHGWITQQINHVEATAGPATSGPWYASEYHYDPDGDFTAQLGGSPGAADIAGHGYEGGGVDTMHTARHIALHDPAAVLRRCEADRRVLARHRANPDALSRLDTVACEGCGVYGDCDLPVTDNVNDCPELLDLAHAHGITDEILAGLDRPEPPPREHHPAEWVAYTIRDALAPRTPMIDVPPPLRGPDWKDHTR